MGTTDPMIAKLQTLRLALQDPDTWSLKPLAVLCGEAIELRQKELGTLPPKRMSPRRHDIEEPIMLEDGELWP